MGNNKSAVKIFTSDYALQRGTGLTTWAVTTLFLLSLAGTNSITTENIALVRGAADMQGKNWGAMITWESQSPPYLPTGSQMYGEMKQAYESGAEYVVVFNFAPDIDSTAGLLARPALRYTALQNFWTRRSSKLQ